VLLLDAVTSSSFLDSIYLISNNAPDDYFFLYAAIKNGVRQSDLESVIV
jgi:hypothetical protein